MALDPEHFVTPWRVPPETAVAVSRHLAATIAPQGRGPRRFGRAIAAQSLGLHGDRA